MHRLLRTRQHETECYVQKVRSQTRVAKDVRPGKSQAKTEPYRSWSTCHNVVTVSQIEAKHRAHGSEPFCIILVFTTPRISTCKRYSGGFGRAVEITPPPPPQHRRFEVHGESIFAQVLATSRILQGQSLKASPPSLTRGQLGSGNQGRACSNSPLQSATTRLTQW